MNRDAMIAKLELIRELGKFEGYGSNGHRCREIATEIIQSMDSDSKDAPFATLTEAGLDDVMRETLAEPWSDRKLAVLTLIQEVRHARGLPPKRPEELEQRTETAPTPSVSDAEPWPLFICACRHDRRAHMDPDGEATDCEECLCTAYTPKNELELQDHRTETALPDPRDAVVAAARDLLSWDWGHLLKDYGKECGDVVEACDALAKALASVPTGSGAT